MTTIKQAKAILKTIGYSLSKRDGEFRVAPLSGSPADREDCAIYTNDITDAIQTAQAEYNRMNAPAPLIGQGEFLF